MNQTVGSLIKWSEEYLAKKQISTPRLDSEILLANSLSTERSDIYLNIQRSLSSIEFQKFKKLVERRALREPLHYIVGVREFWSLPFKVNHHVLIPRPETEILIEKALNILKIYYSNCTELIYVNDIGTGCGNIAISLSKEWKGLHLDATDSSEKALSVAAENAVLNNVSHEIRFRKRELFGDIKNKNKAKYDLIVSNPPYIPSDEIKTLQPEIKDYEPLLALDGGPDGLDFYRKIIARTPNYLAQNGFIIFEMGYNQGSAISGILKNKGCFSEIEITKDYSGNDRIVSARYTSMLQ